MPRRLGTLLVLLLTLVGCAVPGGTPGGGPTLWAKRVAALPVIDGSGDDEAWRGARALEVTAVGVWGANVGKTTKVAVKSVYTDTHIAFLVSWEDATRDDKAHKPWVWNAENKAYEQGKEQEDAVALAFEHTGPFTADMLSHVDAVWDLWTWKATRTDPVGYAQDKTHRYSTTKPQGSAKEYASRTGAPVWIQRPEDAGSSVQMSQKAPATYSGDVLPQYTATVPGGSAADVRAKGRWQGGRWTVELARKLNTGNPDDTAFDPARAYSMAVAVQDRTGDMGQASPLIRLMFEPR